MNETLALQFTHRSDRSFSTAPISDDQLENIIEAAWHAPSSMNAQHVSLVVVRNAAKRARIAELAGGQPWIAEAPVFITVIVDFNKTSIGLQSVGATQHIHESVDGFAAGAVDAGIALGNLMLAARSLGLGVVAIGGLRRNPQEMIDLLELPALTYPIAGVAIGHIATPAQPKPRLPLASFRHDERYHAEAIAPAIATYDKVLPEYWHSIGRADGLPWSANLAKPYSQGFYRATKPVAARQGFVQEQ
jgi:FMN reductase [NAD(P)H]